MTGKNELPKIKCRTGLFQYYRNTLILGTLIMIDPFIHATAQEFQTVLSFSQDTLPVSNFPYYPPLAFWSISPVPG
jgi:hypothetical protein